MEKRADSHEERVALAVESRILLEAHPAFPRLFDVAPAFASPEVIVVERIVGAPLTSETVGPNVLADLLTALEHLHQRGFVHGDLKPEHLLVDAAGRGRVIDVGLAQPLGAALRGGTVGFVPPERREDAAASVAGDLFSFGAALAETLREPSPLVRALIDACTQVDRSRRPASALACIHLLGATRRRIDVAGAFPRLGSSAVLDGASRAARNSTGATLVIHATQGSGRRRLLRDLELHALARRDGAALTSGALVRASLDDGSFVERFGGTLGSRITGERERDLASAALAAARAGLCVVTIADSSLDAAEILSAAFDRAGRGTLVLIASPGAVRTEGREVMALDTATEPDVDRVFDAAGARLSPELRTAALAATGGRFGVLARLARGAADAPLSSADELARAVRRIDEGEPGFAERGAPPTVAAAEEANQRGEFARAAEIAQAVLESADADDSPGGAPRAYVEHLLAVARARSGDYAGARAALASMRAPSSADRLVLVECLERMGLHADTRAEALAITYDERVGVCALALAAHATLALGDPVEAENLAATGLERLSSSPPEAGLFSTSREIVGRLHCIRSDAALRRGDVDRALAFADEALAHASEHQEHGLAAQAHARLGAAKGLSGEPRRALTHYAEALANAERAGDLGRLPAFIMNLATAEHALGEIGLALEHYQEAATLSTRLGRTANLLAATVNLAGLWIFLGAGSEAEVLLDRADRLAEQLGDAVYRAQSMMLRAELAASEDVPRALELAEAARARFVAAGASRQALESELLSAELAAKAGAAERALAFVARGASDLAAAGLGARASILAARAAFSAGKAEVAATHAARAMEDAAGDHELELLARFELARARESMVPGAGAATATRARDDLRSFRDRLPHALRASFMKTPARAAVERGLDAASAPATAPGLGNDAKRLLVLVRRLLLEGEESRVLEAAIDEAVAMTGAERAFLVLSRPKGAPEVVVARNVDKAAIRTASFRFSRSVVDKVIKTGEAVVTASALDDPSLDRTRSILDLGLRSILAVPIRGPQTVLGALYLDHRIERGRFADAERELTTALADIVGMALEKTRLVEQAERRADASARHAEAAERENVEKAREVERLAQLLSRAKTSPEDQGGIVGSSHKLLAALDVARRVAKSDLPVLVRGESGTGKELFARFVHAESARKRGPFIAINCGAVPESLLESELFGHKRGAFTGAVTDSPGLFRLADGGTLFLDEIGEMPLRMQTRLLRVLQEGEVRAVGGSENVKVDVRILAATHRNLEEATGLGTFREDLYYRLLGARVTLPALRERREDILEIARAVLSRLEKRYARTFALSRATESTLLKHDWPGNVRELEQTLTRGALLAEGAEIGPESLDLRRHETTRRVELQNLDRTLIEQALHAAKGNRTLAAKALGVSRVTLHRWMKRYDVT